MDQELTGFRFDDGQVAALNGVPPKIDSGTLTCASNAVIWSITAAYYHPSGPKRGFGQIEIACVRKPMLLPNWTLFCPDHAKIDIIPTYQYIKVGN